MRAGNAAEKLERVVQIDGGQIHRRASGAGFGGAYIGSLTNPAAIVSPSDGAQTSGDGDGAQDGVSADNAGGASADNADGAAESTTPPSC